MEDRSPLFKTLRPIVIAPTHNNDQTLPDMLQRIAALDIAAMIVNDGSTDATAHILQGWAGDDRSVFTHAENQGKAAALQTAFAHALTAGFTHAITIDTDGQLSPQDIPRLLQKSARAPSAMVLGVRDIKARDYPRRSRLGRWISNLLVRFETGHRVSDSQCGLRVYPLQLVSDIRCGAGHYGFETEIITRSLWAGVVILEAPVQCQYFNAARRVSHFKPFVDSMRAIAMHLRLIAIAMNPFPKPDSAPGTAPARSLPMQFLHWLNPITAWRQIRHHEGARTRFAAGFAVGVFIANLPLYGIQTLVALFAARRFHLHPVSVFAGVNISTPPIGPLMIAMGIATGHLLLHGSLPHLQNYHPAPGKLHDLLLPMLLEWIVGSIVLGFVMSAVSFLILDCLLRIVSDPKPAPGAAK